MGTLVERFGEVQVHHVDAPAAVHLSRDTLQELEQISGAGSVFCETML